MKNDYPNLLSINKIYAKNTDAVVYSIPNLLSINKIFMRNTDDVVYSIKYIMLESINNQNIDSENPLCLSLSDVDAYIIAESGNNYVLFALIKKRKQMLGICRKSCMSIIMTNTSLLQNLVS